MIGVFDSGEGGLSVLREIAKILPDHPYIYFSDNAYCPYGEKGREFILGRSREITLRLVEEGAQIIVVACNTATAAAISSLREEFSTPTDKTRRMLLERSGGRQDNIHFIGMEPAVKPAALGTKSGVIGVLATSGTLKGSKYLTTKGAYEEDCKIVEHVGKGFVELVEEGDLDSAHAEAVISQSLRPLLDEGADTIVLGCTHYPFLLGAMRRIAGPHVRFIDPAPAVARHLIYVMVGQGILSEKEATSALSRVIRLAELSDRGEEAPPFLRSDGTPYPDVKLLSSGDRAPLRRIFSLIYPGAGTNSLP